MLDVNTKEKNVRVKTSIYHSESLKLEKSDTPSKVYSLYFCRAVLVMFKLRVTPQSLSDHFTLMFAFVVPLIKRDKDITVKLEFEVLKRSHIEMYRNCIDTAAGVSPDSSHE